MVARGLGSSVVAKLVADRAGKGGRARIRAERSGSDKSKQRQRLGLRRTGQEKGRGPLQTSALPLGYGAGTVKTGHNSGLSQPTLETVARAARRPADCGMNSSHAKARGVPWRPEPRRLTLGDP